ncbi:unnamed protein product [Camellia sinensis]
MVVRQPKPKDMCVSRSLSLSLGNPMRHSLVDPPCPAKGHVPRLGEPLNVREDVLAVPRGKIELDVSINNCPKCKTKVLKAVTKIEGIDKISVDSEKGKLTVIGDVDPVLVVTQVRKTGKKIEVKVSIHCHKCKSDVLKSVTKLQGIDQVSVDSEKGILTVIGNVDPVLVANQVRKTGKVAELTGVGPPKAKETPPPKPPTPVCIPDCCCNKCQLVAVSYAVPYDNNPFCSIL